MKVIESAARAPGMSEIEVLQMLVSADRNTVLAGLKQHGLLGSNLETLILKGWEYEEMWIANAPPSVPGN